MQNTKLSKHLSNQCEHAMPLGDMLAYISQQRKIKHYIDGMVPISYRPILLPILHWISKKKRKNA